MKHKIQALIASALTTLFVGHAEAATLVGTAESAMIGQTSTANRSGGGDPRYFATDQRYSGVVSLVMRNASGGASLCTGSLLSDHMSILTAGHCVSGGAGSANPVSTTAYFYHGGNPDAQPYSGANAAGTVADAISAYFVNPKYTGQAIDNNDIAVLRLSEAAPDWATSYDLYDGTDLTGKEFNLAGYGQRSTAGGSVGADINAIGVLRQGDNTFDFRAGDAAFGGGLVDTLSAISGGNAANDQIYLADFDDGSAAHDSGCLVSQALGVGDGRFCNTGLGAKEAAIGHGDSGSGSFIDGKLATVTSFELSFGSAYGDTDDLLNSTFGEFGGYVPVSIHSDFIRGAMLAAVPEPAMWAMMVLGFGLVGGSMRRQRFIRATPRLA